jgi:uncharacterized protein YjiS (DUF1127 family)
MCDEATAAATRTDLGDVASTLFFVVGPSRSGTTLLQAMLNAHSRLCVPPETHFFPYEAEFDGLISRVRWGRGLDAFVRFLFEEKRRLADLGLEREPLLAEARRLNLTSKRALFLLILARYRKQAEDGEIVGEKTPRHLLHAQTLACRYPDARFLVLFRDPRAKALSERHVPFGSPSLFVATRRWRQYARAFARLRRTVRPERLHEMSYEALVRHPRREVEHLASFLGVAFENDMLAFYDRDERGYPSREDWKQNTTRPIEEKHIDKWKRELSGREIALIERTAGPELEERGYDRAAEGRASAGALAATWARDYSRAVRKDARQLVQDYVSTRLR